MFIVWPQGLGFRRPIAGIAASRHRGECPVTEQKTIHLNVTRDARSYSEGNETETLKPAEAGFTRAPQMRSTLDKLQFAAGDDAPFLLCFLLCFLCAGLAAGAEASVSASAVLLFAPSVYGSNFPDRAPSV